MKYLLSIFITLLALTSYTQSEDEASHKLAKNSYGTGDYKVAYDEYKALLQTEPNNTKYNYQLGIIILESNVEPKGKAVTYFEKIKDKDDAPYDVLLQLGIAYHQAYRFHDAIKVLHDFFDHSKDDYLNEIACNYLEYATHAIDLVKQPLSVEIKNLGEVYNSESPDYYPFVDEDENILLFTTRRDKGNGGYEMVDGHKSGEIFMLKEKRGAWAKPRSIGGAVGTGLDEEIVGFSNDGEYVFINLDTYEISGEIMVAKKKGRQYQKPYLLSEYVNTPFLEVTATVSRDKETLYFSSDRPDGYGEADLWYSKRLPDGTYGLPSNMGPNINTYHNEYFPMLSSDEKTFYFSSEGHHGMGGFDIYYCKWDEVTQTWGKPQNFGYPVNTPDHNMQISLTRDGKRGYVSASLNDTYGDLDIYEVHFTDVEEKQTAVTGKIYTMAPVDYNDYINFYYFKKDSITKRFTDAFMPPDTTWKLVKEKKSIIKPGKEHRISLSFEKNGEIKKFALAKAPIGDTTYVFKDIRIMEMPIKDYKPYLGSKPEETEVLLGEVFIDVFEKTTGMLVGNYVPSKKSAKYVAILEPGTYEAKIELEGYKPFVKVLKVYGKGSYKQLLTRDFLLEPLVPLPPIHYSELE